MPRSYSFVHKSPDQTNIELIKKFDDWEYQYVRSLGKRMPYVKKGWLTTSPDIKRIQFGSIVGTQKWINTLIQNFNTIDLRNFFYS